FLSGLRKIETFANGSGEPQEAWRPKQVLHFIQDNYIHPDIVVDVTDYWDKKMASVFAYGSQFHNPEWNGDEPQTYISSPQFTAVVEGRGREFGKAIGVKFAEGFTSKKILGVDNLMDLR
ncbi:MAG: bshB1, partial [Chitinophagaceae bacterium]|nr:bshB1 [Chitinophagaceae bacterium]